MQTTFRPIVISLVLLILAGVASAQDREVKVAAYNAQWMLDVWDDPYSEDEGFKPKAREELDALAATLRELDADVVAFEELEAEGLLRAFVNTYLADMGYEYVLVQPTNNERGQNLGLISRLPVTQRDELSLQDAASAGGGGEWGGEGGGEGGDVAICSGLDESDAGTTFGRGRGRRDEAAAAGCDRGAFQEQAIRGGRSAVAEVAAGRGAGAAGGGGGAA